MAFLSFLLFPLFAFSMTREDQTSSTCDESLLPDERTRVTPVSTEESSAGSGTTENRGGLERSDAQRELRRPRPRRREGAEAAWSPAPAQPIAPIRV